MSLIHYLDARNELISLLEQQLDLVRRGKIESVAVASVLTSGETSFGWGGWEVECEPKGKLPPSVPHLLGAIDVLKARMMLAFLGVNTAPALPMEDEES